MEDQIVKLTVGGLLHDIGKVVYRARKLSGTHSKRGAEWLEEKGFIKDKDILDQVRYHHAQEIRVADEISLLAYITYIADNIASGTDRRKAPIEGDEDNDKRRPPFNIKTPLQSVFKLVNSEEITFKENRKFYRPMTLKARLETEKYEMNYPGDRVRFERKIYQDILCQITKKLETTADLQSNANKLLEILEETLSFIPSSTLRFQVPDISLYDHLKLTAAIGCCIYGYLESEESVDFKNRIFGNEKNFYDEKFAVIYSFDISGIQDFIYTIHSDKALKTLRSRSFYLEILTENIIDNILEAVGLSRANLLYNGGGHAYLMLPNSEGVLKSVGEVINETNSWLLEKFGEQLYVAAGYSECSGNDLMKHSEVPFNKANAMISNKKLRRYTYEELRELDKRFPDGHHAEGNECKVCQTIDRNINEEGFCKMCDAFRGFEHKELYVLSDASTYGRQKGIELLKNHLISIKEDELDKFSKENTVNRVYRKNLFSDGQKKGTKIWVGDHASNKDLSEYAKIAEGIDRLGVLRMDIDNLGTTFTKGFDKASKKYETDYKTISRIATLSRTLSLFFKLYINKILADENREITIIYSGGDDAFLIGSWDHIYQFAAEFQQKFEQFTQGRLTLSAGLGLYPSKYPVHLMAKETGELEKWAKESGKNRITLFMPELTFTWPEFKVVIDEKLSMLREFIKESDSSIAFLHKILRLLPLTEEGPEPINIARLVYMLARHEVESNEKKHQEYMKQIYGYAIDSSERKQLIAAIYLYLYEMRVHQGQKNRREKGETV